MASGVLERYNLNTRFLTSLYPDSIGYLSYVLQSICSTENEFKVSDLSATSQDGPHCIEDWKGVVSIILSLSKGDDSLFPIDITFPQIASLANTTAVGHEKFDNRLVM